MIIYKPSLGSHEVPHKIWARSLQPFWRLLDTNKQTEKLNLCIASKVLISIDCKDGSVNYRDCCKCSVCLTLFIYKLRLQNRALINFCVRPFSSQITPLWFGWVSSCVYYYLLPFYTHRWEDVYMRKLFRFVIMVGN